MKKGIEQEKMIIAERLLSENADLTFIAKITELPLAAKPKVILTRFHRHAYATALH